MVRRTTATSTTTTTTATLNNTIIPPKKKKGRPSFLDLQQRKLLQQQQQQQHKNKIKNPNSQSQSQFPNRNQSNPNSTTLFRRPRSTRRIPNLPAHFIDGSDSDDDDHHHHHQPNHNHNQHSDNSENSENSDEEEEEDDDDDERAQKKVKLVVQFPNPNSNSNSNSNIKKFRNAVIKDEKGSKATDNENGTRRMQGALEHGPTTSTSNATTTVATTTRSTALPDKKLLLLILDRLQKKDTRGVFAEPVDPDELPDYHEIIENPMDFDTVRKKLLGGLYSNLEQLEDDINLICSNAMQYNAPSTVFFRQARAIQELTKKEFETLRQDGALTELPAKPRRGRPPGSRNLKKLLEKSSPPDRSVRESSSDATPASREDTTKSGNYNLRKGPSLYRFPRNFDNCFDLSASSSKSMSAKYGKKPFGSDDTRRETYYLGEYDFGKDSQLMATFGGPERQLTPVGLGSDHSYARSLAKFAADLGPDIWRIASKKISSVLPPGVEFGPGWVGENDTRLVRSNSVSRDPSMSEAHHMSTSGLVNSSFISKPPTSSEKSTEYRESNSNIHKGGNGVVGPNPSWHIQHQGSVYPRMNGFNGNFVSGSQYQEATAKPTSSSLFNPQALDPSSFDASRSFPGVMNSENDMVTHGMPYWQNLSMQERWDRPYPVELNGGFQASGSRSLPIGSPPQVDLVLQL